MSLKKIIDLDLLDRFLAKVKELIPTKTSDLVNDSRYMVGMTILSYGKSTWADFMEAYGDNKVVYCRASSNSNPASGSQTRMAFMAYVNNQTTPTEVEFQYYRSVNVHTDSQQGDQVYVYKLNKNNGWSVIVRNAFSKLAVGTGLTHTYSNGTITIDNSEVVPGVVSTTANGLAPQLPNESTTTKFLRQDATWAVPPDTTYESKAAASGGTDVSLVTTGEKYIWNTKELPSGGSAGQVLKKSSATDYSVEWGDASGGGSMLVTFTQVSGSTSYTADKTFAEVYAAFQNGTPIFAMAAPYGEIYSLKSASSARIIFSYVQVFSGGGLVQESIITFNSNESASRSSYNATIKKVNENPIIEVELDDSVNPPRYYVSASGVSDAIDITSAYNEKTLVTLNYIKSSYDGAPGDGEESFEQYHLSNVYSVTTCTDADEGTYIMKFHFVFTNEEVSSSGCKIKKFELVDDAFTYNNLYDATVTYSEVSLAVQ